MSDNSLYVLQVRTNREDKFIKTFNKHLEPLDIKLYFPRRIIEIKKNGKIRKTKPALFPGYVILESPCDTPVYQCLHTFKSSKNFVKFLGSNTNIIQVKYNDLVFLRKLLNLGPVIGKSDVTFDENSRIVVLEGPLKDFQGTIVKVDRRKKRAKIKLDINDNVFLIDLAYNVIERTA